MKAFRTLALACCILGIALPASYAGKKGNGEKKMGYHKILKQFDTNNNGVIDPGAESDALRQAFATNPALKYLDTNNDGKLDDSEIAAIKAKHNKKNKNANA